MTMRQIIRLTTLVIALAWITGAALAQQAPPAKNPFGVGPAPVEKSVAAPAAAVPPVFYYAGPYATQAECRADQQVDPDAVSACIFRSAPQPGWYYRARVF